MNKLFDFKTIKAQLSIEQVLAVYGFNKNLKQIGTQLRGPCPIHGGDNPTAFRAHLSKGIWHCFTSCGGGDIVDLVRKIEHCSFAQAARKLHCIVYGGLQHKLDPIFNHPTLSPQKKKGSFRPFTRSIPLTHKVCFLQKSKKITVTTANVFESGVTGNSKFLKGVVAVRLHDSNGNPIGYCGRHLHDQDIVQWGKWRFPKNFPKNNMLYNAHRAKMYRSKTIFVVEGPWGVMRLTQAGVPNSVALLGANASPFQLDWLAQFSSVVLLLDGDNVGRKAARKIYKTLISRTQVVIHRLTKDMDPDDLTDIQLRDLCKIYCACEQLSFRKKYKKRRWSNA